MPIKRLASNVVIDSIRRLGGQKRAMILLDVSAPTLARWRRNGRLEKLDNAVTLTEALERGASARWALIRKLSGLPK